MARPPVIFLGPSLDRGAAARILPEADLRPPIRRGDLAPLLVDPPAAVGIIDGEFYQSLCVSPKEILPLLARGVPVFGSSSMGALRAAELHSLGMIGVGTVFTWFRQGRVAADDEVAMTFCPATLRALSEPLVNFRVALREAQRAGAVSAQQRVALSRLMKRRYFPARTLAAFWRDVERLEIPRLRDWWAVHAPNAKADDARALLAAVGAVTCGSTPETPASPSPASAPR